MGPKRPVQHEIDKRARGILDQAVASWASTNPHHEDYGIDYTAEVFSVTDSNLKSASGVEFQIQLKGTDSARYVDDAIAFSFDTERLAHILEKKRLPVFLVVIDTEKGVGAFVFLQDHAMKCLPADWRSQKTVTIHLPESNSIHDAQVFEAAVRAADARMAELRPGSVSGAIQAEKDRLESLDPRVQVMVSADAKGSRIEIHAKEDIHGTIQFRGPGNDLQRLMHHFWDRGELVNPADFGVSVAVTGLPLLPSAEESIAQLQFCRQFPGTVRLSLVRSERDLGSIDINGEWTAGTKLASLTASLPHRIMTVIARVGERCDKGVPIHFEFAFSIEHWIGKDILTDLKYFDVLNRLFGEAREGDSVRMELSIEGNFVGAALAPIEDLDWACHAAALCSLLTKLKYICQRTKSTLSLEVAPRTEHVAQIEYAYAFLKGEEVSISASSGSVTTAGGTDRVEVGAVRVGALALRQEAFMCDVFSRSIDCGPGEIVVAQAEMRALQVEQDGGEQVVKWAFVPVGRTFARIVADQSKPPTIPLS